MKILLMGPTKGNTGPSNVHKALVESWPVLGEIVSLESSSKLTKVFDSIKLGLSSDLVISPGSSWTEIIAHKVFAFFGKPVVCFNHGYVPYENEINHLDLSSRAVKAIDRHLASADYIVTNSLLQENFVKSKLPEVSNRIDHVTLGLLPFGPSGNIGRRKPIIAVSGGTRPIKANEVVAQAVALLNKKGIDCKLRVYGRRYSANAALDEAVEAGIAEYRGQVDNTIFVSELSVCSVFVMDSRHEPFGLSAIDAIKAGCSLLLSRNCGVGELLQLESGDVVEDCEDAVEVAAKIEPLLLNSNNQRLYDSIDFEKATWSNAAKRLRDICLRVVENCGKK